MGNIDFSALNGESIMDLILRYGPKFLGALVIMFIGWKLVRLIARRLSNTMDKKMLTPGYIKTPRHLLP